MTGLRAPARVLGVGTVVPRHHLSQADAEQRARALFASRIADIDRLLPMFRRAGVEDRYFCVPAAWFETEHDLGERNDVYVEEATALSCGAATAALDAAGVRPDQVGAIHFVSSTGFATPSLDAVLADRLGLPADVRRDATFGHGCAGGAGGLARAAEWARANPGRHALLIATELCGLALQRSDASTTNVVATSLFGDGSAAVVLGTDGHGPAVVGESSTLWPDTADVMGWRFGPTGLHVMLSRSVPSIVRTHFAASVDQVCTTAGISRSDLGHFVLHPGGPKVLDALADALGIDAEQLRHSHDVLRHYGNMSAPTVLFVLERFLRESSWSAGDLALVSAMGPGFAAEHVVLRCD